jgi:threonine/homoserine/homoserine lactone efflux protein
VDITVPALSVAATAFVVELTPGPNMAWLGLLAATEGRKRGLAAVAGVAAGLAIVGLAAAFGLAALVQTYPAAYQALRIGGILYLLWLAWSAWSGAEKDQGARMGQTIWRYFRQGLIPNVLNPKAAVFYITILPEFLPDTPNLAQTVRFSAIYVAVATLVHAAIVAGAGATQGLLSNPTRLALARRTMALALVGVAIWLFLRT